MITVIRVLFAVSILGMFWWAFLWPVAISVEPDNRLYQVGSIMTLLLFFGCIVLLLVLRLRAPRQRGH
ncbi:MAG: hypothetical protein HYR49_05300 [Gammaproteobacteria bacterium]|nr:hypothetical protein [Gammaproteobacteria bacterium]